MSTLQCVHILLRRRWRWTLTFTRMAAAPPSGAPLVGFPHLHKLSGSGCPKRTVQRPSCKSHRERERENFLLCMPAMFTCFCWFRRGIAAFVMLTQTREETMRTHSDLIQISGCDSCSSQCPFLEGPQLVRLRMRYLLTYSLDQLFKMWQTVRSRLPPQVCSDLVNRKEEAWAKGCFDHPYLLPTHQSQIFLIPALCFLLFLTCSLSKKKEAFSCWSCSSSCTLSFSLSRTPFVFEKIVDKHFLCFLIWIDSCIAQQKQKRDKKNLRLHGRNSESQSHFCVTLMWTDGSSESF